MKTNSNFGLLLKTYRKSLGWSQEELAQGWNYSFETISAWERGKRVPGKESIPRIAKLLEIEAEELAETIIQAKSQDNQQSLPDDHQLTKRKWKETFDTWGELQKIYRTRTEFNEDFPYTSMFTNAQNILAVGISLNSIALSYSHDRVIDLITKSKTQIKLCFLEPFGTRCAEREKEERHPPQMLSNLTSVNIHLMQAIQSIIESSSPELSQNLEIRTYDIIPRFNIYIVDDTWITVQSYGYGRGEDTPTLMLKRQIQGGLFDFYANLAKHVLANSKLVPNEESKEEDLH